MKLLKCAVLLACLSIVTNAYAADILRYTLVNGSMITPYYGADPIGPPELLTGNFDWIQVEDSNIIGFNATYLDFQSESYRIELNNTTVNDLGTSVFKDSCLTYFGEIVDLTDLSVPTGNMQSYSGGCYSGSPYSPTSLTYTDVRISPVGGGLFVARLSIIAALDSDRDGVPDDPTDQCPGTADGAVIDAQGCSIDQLVPCDGPTSGGYWKNHAQYVSAVDETAGVFLENDLITIDQKRAIVKAAVRSSCGKK